MFLLVLCSCMSNENEKRHIAERIMTDKCDVIEQHIKHAVSAKQCLCMQDELINKLIVLYSLKELKGFQHSPKQFEVIISEWVETNRDDMHQCL